MVVFNGCKVTAIDGEELTPHQLELIIGSVNNQLLRAREAFSEANSLVSDLNINGRQIEPEHFHIHGLEQILIRLREARETLHKRTAQTR